MDPNTPNKEGIVPSVDGRGIIGFAREAGALIHDVAKGVKEGAALGVERFTSRGLSRTDGATPEPSVDGRGIVGTINEARVLAGDLASGISEGIKTGAHNFVSRGIAPEVKPTLRGLVRGAADAMKGRTAPVAPAAPEVSFPKQEMGGTAIAADSQQKSAGL